MNKQKLRISAAIMSALMILLSVIESFFASTSLIAVGNSIVNPVLFLAALVCIFFAFKDTLTFTNKWAWVAIAIQFTYALSFIVSVPLSFFRGTVSILVIIHTVLIAIGGVAILLALIEQKFAKLLPIGFVAMALGNFLLNNANITTVILFAILAVMAWGKLSGINGLLRIAAIVFAVISINNIGYYIAASCIILAFLIAPAKKFGRLGFAKVTAILALITAIASIIVFFNSSVFYGINNIKENIAEAEDEIVEIKEDIKDFEEDITYYTTKLSTAKKNLATANADYNAAKSALSKVCYRLSYSYYYCSYKCKSLHYDVDDLLSDIEDLEYDISSYNDYIDNYKEKIEDCNAEIEGLNKSIALYKSNIAGEVVSIAMSFIALGITTAALIFFVICFFKASYGKTALISCALMGLGSFIFILLGTHSYAPYSFDLLNYPIFRIISSAGFWAIVANALLACIFFKKEGKIIRFRVFTIIAAAIMAALGILNMPEGIVYALYAITLILASLVLVPPVFTEYNNVAKHIFFSIITLGIWNIIWIYNVTKNLCKVSTVEKRKPVPELLFCFVLPFYVAYWTVKTTDAVNAYAAENGKDVKVNALSYVFAFVCPFVSTILIQDKINMIVGKPE